jgi:hypothetical protein
MPRPVWPASFPVTPCFCSFRCKAATVDRRHTRAIAPKQAAAPSGNFGMGIGLDGSDGSYGVTCDQDF